MGMSESKQMTASDTPAGDVLKETVQLTRSLWNGLMSLALIIILALVISITVAVWTMEVQGVKLKQNS